MISSAPMAILSEYSPVPNRSKITKAIRTEFQANHLCFWVFQSAGRCKLLFFSATTWFFREWKLLLYGRCERVLHFKGGEVQGR